MLSHDVLDIVIERRKGKYCVLIIDKQEINRIPELSKKQALKIYGALALCAIEIGLKVSKRPTIMTKPTSQDDFYDKPVNIYHMSHEMQQWLNAA